MPDTDQLNAALRNRISFRNFEHPLLAVISYLLRKQSSALDWYRLVREQGRQLICRSGLGNLSTFAAFLGLGLTIGSIILMAFDVAASGACLLSGLVLFSLSAYFYRRRQQQLASPDLRWAPEGVGYYLLVKLVQPILFDAKTTAYYAEYTIRDEVTQEALNDNREPSELPAEKDLRAKLSEIAHRLTCLIAVSDDHDLRPQWSKAIHHCLQHHDCEQQPHRHRMEEAVQALVDVLETLHGLEISTNLSRYQSPTEEIEAAYRDSSQSNPFLFMHPFRQWSMATDAALTALKNANHTMIGCHCEEHS